jgi:hypothetical protein
MYLCVTKTHLSPLTMGNVPDADVLSPHHCNLLVVGCNGERIHVLGQGVLVKNTASCNIPDADLAVLFRSDRYKKATCTLVPSVFQEFGHVQNSSQHKTTDARNRTNFLLKADPRDFSDYLTKMKVQLRNQFGGLPCIRQNSSFDCPQPCHISQKTRISCACRD